MQNKKEHGNNNPTLLTKADSKTSKNSGNISVVHQSSKDYESVWESDKLPELRSEAINEVLSNPPAWLVRWGITVMLFLVSIFLLITWFIKYPDLIGGSMKIVSVNIPKSVTTKTDGRLIKLFAKDKDFVNRYEVLGIMESSADYEEVLILEKKINELIDYSKRLDFTKIKVFRMPFFYQLGELQNNYVTLQENLIQSHIYLQEKNVLKKKGLQREVATFKLFQDLKQDKTIAENKMNNSIAENKNNLIQSINSLKNDIEGWKQKYILHAPVAGEVAFIGTLQENQTFRNRQDLFYIIPENEGIYGEMFLSQFNLGEVRIGADVIVKISSYPFEKHGIVRGKVESISEMPVDSLYMVRINFPKGLTTNISKKIPFKNGIVAQGQIITSDLRLAERFFYEIKKIVHKNE